MAATYSTQQANFIATELPYAQAQSARTGIPVSVFLTQSSFETGWGTSGHFLTQNNPAGIGVSSNSAPGFTYPDLATAFKDYADKLLGIGESGQQQFAADVAAKAPAQTLLFDLEASPWAGGHYGGTGLNQRYAEAGLGSFDAPGATAPTGATTIKTTAYIPGTGVHIPGTGAGSSINPLPGIVSGVAGDWLNPIFNFVRQGAIRTALIVFGIVAVLLGMALLIKDTGQTARDDETGHEEAQEQSSEERDEAPSQREPTAQAQPQTQSQASQDVGKAADAGAVAAAG